MEKVIFKDLELFIVRKKIKNLYIRIKHTDGVVKVSAPCKMKQREIDAFLHKSYPWVKKSLQRTKKTELLSKNYLPGEQVLFFGKKYYLDTVESCSEGVEIAGDRMILFVKNNNREKRRKVVVEWRRRCLQQYIQEKREQWEKITGCRANEWRIKDMKTRWGSCNAKDRRVWLSLALTEKDKECTDYVMVHELVHFKDQRHNKRFYNFLTDYYPEWKRVRKKLKN